MKFFHRQERGLELFLRHPWIEDALKGATRSHAEAGTKVACTWTCSVERAPCGCESWCHQWGWARGAGAVAGTRGFVFLLARASEMFASKEGRWDDGHILRRGDVAFFRGRYPTRSDNVGSG